MPRVFTRTFFVSVSQPPLQLFFREVFQKLPLKVLTTVSAGSADIPATAQSQTPLRAALAGKSGSPVLETVSSTGGRDRTWHARD